eukprot:Rhum_TRINITY_DN7009_c0_g1::Rhum_TRINITY_DN7009_c0_g1_i1::g.21510::m.21510
MSSRVPVVYPLSVNSAEHVRRVVGGEKLLNALCAQHTRQLVHVIAGVQGQSGRDGLRGNGVDKLVVEPGAVRQLVEDDGRGAGDDVAAEVVHALRHEQEGALLVVELADVAVHLLDRRVLAQLGERVAVDVLEEVAEARVVEVRGHHDDRRHRPDPAVHRRRQPAEHLVLEELETLVRRRLQALHLDAVEQVLRAVHDAGQLALVAAGAAQLAATVPQQLREDVVQLRRQEAGEDDGLPVLGAFPLQEPLLGAVDVGAVLHVPRQLVERREDLEGEVEVLHEQAVRLVDDRHLDRRQEVGALPLVLLDGRREAERRGEDDVGAREAGEDGHVLRAQRHAEAEAVVDVAVELLLVVLRAPTEPRVPLLVQLGEVVLEPLQVLHVLLAAAPHLHQLLHVLLAQVAHGQDDEHCRLQEALVPELVTDSLRRVAPLRLQPVVVARHALPGTPHVSQRVQHVRLDDRRLVLPRARGVQQVDVLLLCRQQRPREGRSGVLLGAAVLHHPPRLLPNRARVEPLRRKVRRAPLRRVVRLTHDLLRRQLAVARRRRHLGSQSRPRHAAHLRSHLRRLRHEPGVVVEQPCTLLRGLPGHPRGRRRRRRRRPAGKLRRKRRRNHRPLLQHRLPRRSLRCLVLLVVNLRHRRVLLLLLALLTLLHLLQRL